MTLVLTLGKQPTTGTNHTQRESRPERGPGSTSWREAFTPEASLCSLGGGAASLGASVRPLVETWWSCNPDISVDFSLYSRLKTEE